MIFQQFFDTESNSFSYLLSNFKNSDALLIDPVASMVDDYLLALSQNNLRLSYVIDTHMHDDHLSGLSKLRDQTACITLAHQNNHAAKVSKRLNHGDTISITGIDLTVIETPGHTIDSMCLYFREAGMIFTGDTVWIRGNGHVDIEAGSAARLFDSITTKVFILPDDTLIYPGHDERGENFTFIGRARRQNEYLAGRSREDFITVMESLPRPEQLISSDSQLNKNIGDDVGAELEDHASLSCSALVACLEKGNTIVVDLRDRTEINKTGSISGALNIPYLDVEKALEDNGRLNKILISQRNIVFVCAHGERSSLALLKIDNEFSEKCFHLNDGISAWQAGGYPLL